MALIKCPKCGGNISDSAVKCVHCGADLSAIISKEQLENEYSNMPVEEKQRIRGEYDKINSAYLMLEKKQKKLSVCLMVTAFITAAALILELLFGILHSFDIVDFPITIGVALIIFLVICFVIGYVFYFLLKSSRKLELYELKKFTSWLKREKGLTNNVILSEKDRQIYNSYNVD